MAKALKIALALSALLIATPAKSAVVMSSWDTTYLPSLAQAPPTSFTGTFDAVSGGSVNGVYRSPWEFSAGTCPLDCDYSSIRGGNGTATYQYAQNQASLNMMWGSPDVPPPANYNVLEFFDNGISQGIFNGSTVSALLQAVGTAPNNQNGRGFLRITFLGIFDKIVFTAGEKAFEYVFNIRGSATPQVPLPAGLILLLSGLAGLGFMGRSRAKRA